MASDEYHCRTLITRLTLRSSEDEQLLFDTIEEWLEGCNIASSLAWNECHTTSDVRKLAKHRIKQDTQLGDQHATLACHDVSGAITSCIERRKNGKKASQPRFTSRSKYKDCEHQDHSDRGASVTIAVKGIEKHQDWNVPALNSLPQVRTVRRRASGAVDVPSATHSSVRDDRDPSGGVASRTVGVSE